MRHYTGHDVTDKKLKVTFHRVLWWPRWANIFG